MEPGSGFSSGDMHNNLIHILSSSTGTKAPAHMEDGDFRLSTSTGTPDWLKPES